MLPGYPGHPGVGCRAWTEWNQILSFDLFQNFNVRVDEGLDEAHTKGWTVVDMKWHWRTIYPHDK